MPVLEASDFCRAVYKNRDGQCCLLGWIHFATKSDPENPNEMLIKDLEMFLGNISASRFNDDQENSLAKLAKTWNGFCASLGYTEPVK